MQQPASEVRISDWSSDLCSSDLLEENTVGVGAGVVDRGGEGLAVRSDARIRNVGELAGTVIATREGTPIRLDQVAQVRLGQAIRYGSASENGKEVVVGTAIMRIGENSRTVASAVAERLDGINASLPTDVVIQPVLDRPALGTSQNKTGAQKERKRVVSGKRGAGRVK